MAEIKKGQMIQADFATSPCNIMILYLLIQDKRHFDAGLKLQYVNYKLSKEKGIINPAKFLNFM